MVSGPIQVASLVSFPSSLDPFHGTAFHRTRVVCRLRGAGALGAQGVLGEGGVTGALGGTGDEEDTLDVAASYREVVDTWPGSQRAGGTSQQAGGAAKRCDLERTLDKEEEGEAEGRVPQVGTQHLVPVVAACEGAVAASSGASTAASGVGTCVGAGRVATCVVGGACAEILTPDADRETG